MVRGNDDAHATPPEDPFDSVFTLQDLAFAHARHCSNGNATEGPRRVRPKGRDFIRLSFASPSIMDPGLVGMNEADAAPVPVGNGKLAEPACLELGQDSAERHTAVLDIDAMKGPAEVRMT
jgi:hypothetical protein